ncbi:hypothetical protein BDK51DRAFT_29034 [Blyttiomyces helicus]|uniref:Uncharacterized protein n=1 Tax=Blyttiomyces helicus TaxID=388810 RepID=A0A4P9WEU2_9FUNG|nr:hypothetical protein BDK51DRAFT_29034 [Blyttiomyces helicus]|eukprot:RKO91249.1 hypothetical protein BDK51DRAFT_29034 [Blyttiomyces helicus]
MSGGHEKGGVVDRNNAALDDVVGGGIPVAPCFSGARVADDEVDMNGSHVGLDGEGTEARIGTSRVDGAIDLFGEAFGEAIREGVWEIQVPKPSARRVPLESAERIWTRKGVGMRDKKKEVVLMRWREAPESMQRSSSVRLETEEKLVTLADEPWAWFDPEIRVGIREQSWDGDCNREGREGHGKMGPYVRGRGDRGDRGLAGGGKGLGLGLRGRKVQGTLGLYSGAPGQPVEEEPVEVVDAGEVGDQRRERISAIALESLQQVDSSWPWRLQDLQTLEEPDTDGEPQATEGGGVGEFCLASFENRLNIWEGESSSPCHASRGVDAVADCVVHGRETLDVAAKDLHVVSAHTESVKAGGHGQEAGVEGVDGFCGHEGGGSKLDTEEEFDIHGGFVVTEEVPPGGGGIIGRNSRGQKSSQGVGQGRDWQAQHVGCGGLRRNWGDGEEMEEETEVTTGVPRGGDDGEKTGPAVILFEDDCDLTMSEGNVFRSQHALGATELEMAYMYNIRRRSSRKGGIECEEQKGLQTVLKTYVAGPCSQGDETLTD